MVSSSITTATYVCTACMYTSVRVCVCVYPLLHLFWCCHMYMCSGLTTWDWKNLSRNSSLEKTDSSVSNHWLSVLFIQKGDFVTCFCPHWCVSWWCHFTGLIQAPTFEGLTVAAFPSGLEDSLSPQTSLSMPPPFFLLPYNAPAALALGTPCVPWS